MERYNNLLEMCERERVLLLCLFLLGHLFAWGADSSNFFSGCVFALACKAAATLLISSVLHLRGWYFLIQNQFLKFG